MSYVNGVNLLPATGEWTYDVVVYRGKRVSEAAASAVNAYFAPGGTRTDLDASIDQLQAAFPDCRTVALVIAWFADSTDAAHCKIYPSTTYIGGTFERYEDGAWAFDDWRCSGLTQHSQELIPISSNGSSFVYGGAPSDQAVVRCIRALKARGLRVVFYPFILMDAPGFPWRGRIGLQESAPSAEATAAAAHFLGSATPDQFTRDSARLTVGYSGAADDFSFRRMILHYANLCVVAGGVDLFLLGSELRGLEALRGSAWSRAGALDGDGTANWDYPFISGLVSLCDDVRGLFDSAGLFRDRSGLHNLISYAADWSSWMGCQHHGESGQWPHLDKLWAHDNIDLVCFDNYLPLSDWTTGSGGLDVNNWSKPRTGGWPPENPGAIGLGLEGSPALADKAYLKANIEGGEKFDWYYADGANLGRGPDPFGSGLEASRPQGDRLTQTRQRYYADQQLLANKQLRWWWKTQHRAVYDNGDGAGFAPHGAPTAWNACSKSIAFTEYGYPSCDRGTNQPNVFFDAKSSESATPYWSIWRPVEGGGHAPQEDAMLALLALQAIYEYWVTDGHNETSDSGVKMIEPTFMCVWNWDARPFPVFPARADLWGDAGNWPSGTWLAGKGPFIAALRPDPQAPPSMPKIFPTLAGRRWSVRFTPVFETFVNDHASGRSSRGSRKATPDWKIELSFDRLQSGEISADFESLVGFYAQARGQAEPFLFPAPYELGLGSSVLCRFADDEQDMEEFMSRLWNAEAIMLRTVKP